MLFFLVPAFWSFWAKTTLGQPTQEGNLWLKFKMTPEDVQAAKEMAAGIGILPECEIETPEGERLPAMRREYTLDMESGLIL